MNGTHRQRDDGWKFLGGLAVFIVGCAALVGFVYLIHLAIASLG
jgi:hypothetical protein